MKKDFVQQTVRDKKFVHKTGKKMGLYGEKHLLVPLPERKEKVCFWLGVENKICTGEKTIAPPPMYHLVCS